MKYGESTFDIIYLIFAISSGIFILLKKAGKEDNLMGLSALILGCGDAFHLVPRVINYFSSGDLSFWLGLGKLITSVTMTVFYVFMYLLWIKLYGEKPSKALSAFVFAAAAVRIALCLFPQNEWLTNESPLLWGIIRNVPFVILGAAIVVLYFKKRSEVSQFRFVWLFITLSFLFYIPVTVGAGFVPILGALMLPKTICYMLIITAFLRFILKRRKY